MACNEWHGKHDKTGNALGEDQAQVFFLSGSLEAKMREMGSRFIYRLGGWEVGGVLC